MSKQKMALLDKLPLQYKKLVHELDDIDVMLLLKHLPNHNSHRELINLVELGIDVAARRQEIAQKDLDVTDPHRMPYGSKITSTFSAVLGIPESTISHVTRSVEIMGGDYLRQLAQAAQKQGIKLTYSHIRELNRMPTDDFAEHRQGIIDRIFSGDIVTHRQVTEEVDKLLGVVRRVEAVYYDSEDVEEPQITSKAEKKASSTAPVKGDALGDLPSDTDIDKLCVQLVDLIQQVDKKFDRIEENIRNWRENVAFETLQDMCMDSLDAASSTVREFTHRITDIGLILDDAMQVATAAAVEV